MFQAYVTATTFVGSDEANDSIFTVESRNQWRAVEELYKNEHVDGGNKQFCSEVTSRGTTGEFTEKGGKISVIVLVCKILAVLPLWLSLLLF